MWVKARPALDKVLQHVGRALLGANLWPAKQPLAWLARKVREAADGGGMVRLVGTARRSQLASASARGPPALTIVDALIIYISACAGGG